MTEKGNTAEHNAVLDWRQGDYAVASGGFIHGELPEDASELSPEPVVDDDCIGLAVVSQTCDIVADAEKKPFVVVCPLVKVTEESISLIASGRKPGLAPLEQPPEPNVVVDLSRMMTVSKSLVATWSRRSGLDSESARRNFAFALERMLGRFAFPDAFNNSIRRLYNYIREKYNKDSDASKVFRSLREIRVRASPSWEANEIHIQFYFIIDESIETSISDISSQLDELVRKIEWERPFGWSPDSPYILGSLDDLTARDYAESVELDVRTLSFARDSASRSDN